MVPVDVEGRLVERMAFEGAFLRFCLLGRMLILLFCA